MFEIFEPGWPFPGVGPQGHPQVTTLAHSLGPAVEGSSLHVGLIPGTSVCTRGLSPGRGRGQKANCSGLSTTLQLRPAQRTRNLRKPRSGHLCPSVIGLFSDYSPDAPC